MSDKRDILDKATEILKQSEVPAGPREEVLAQTIRAVQQEQVRCQHRSNRFLSIRRAAIAALIFMTATAAFFFFGKSGQSGLAWADVIDNINRAKAFMYRMELKTTGQPLIPQTGRAMGNMESTITISNRYGMTMDTYMNGQLTQQSYLMPDQRKMVSLMPATRQYMEVTFDDDMLTRIKESNNDPREMVQRMLNTNYTSLGRSEIDGRSVEGIQSSDPKLTGGMVESVTATLWVDVQTALPVRWQMHSTVNDGKTKMNILAHDFQWNIDVDKATFKPVIPDEYSALPTMKMPVMDVQAAIKGLKLCRDITGGYPRSLDMISLAKVQKSFFDQPAIKAKIKALQEADDQDGITQFRMQTLQPIQSLGMFYMRLVNEGKGPCYFGDSVTPDNPDAILMTWKESADTYTVIFGDLRASTLTNQQLEQLQKP